MNENTFNYLQLFVLVFPAVGIGLLVSGIVGFITDKKFDTNGEDIVARITNITAKSRDDSVYFTLTGEARIEGVSRTFEIKSNASREVLRFNIEDNVRCRILYKDIDRRKFDVRLNEPGYIPNFKILHAVLVVFGIFWIIFTSSLSIKVLSGLL
jgi:hypothetical protein